MNTLYWSVVPRRNQHCGHNQRPWSISRKQELLTHCWSNAGLVNSGPALNQHCFVFVGWIPEKPPRKPQTLSQCWYNVGPASETVGQHCTNIGWTYRFAGSPNVRLIMWGARIAWPCAKLKWNESGFRPPLCTYRLNWARRTSWGWWDDWDDWDVLQTQDSKFEPWRSEAEHATSRSRRLPTILTFTRGWGRNIFWFFQTAETGNRTPNSGVKGSGANHYPRAPALREINYDTLVSTIIQRFCDRLITLKKRNKDISENLTQHHWGSRRMHDCEAVRRSTHCATPLPCFIPHRSRSNRSMPFCEVTLRSSQSHLYRTQAKKCFNFASSPLQRGDRL